jgi:hypothetical protein
VENFHEIKVRKEKKMTTSHLRAIPSDVLGSIEVRENEVFISNLTVNNQELVTYLDAYPTPQEKILALLDLIDLAVQVRSLAGSTLETENVKKSAEIVVQSLNGTVATVLQRIDSAALKLIDPETGVIAQKLREATESINDDSNEALKSMLSPKDAASPIGQLLTSVTTALNTHVNGIKTDINSVTELLNKFIGSQDKKKELYVKSREKGGDLEEILDAIIQREAAVHGDDARYTGDTSAPSGANVGDEVITLHPSVTANSQVNIVWEAKTDMTFKDAKGRLKREKLVKELNSAITNRDAVCGIFVSDTNGLDLEVQPIWQEFEGNKLAIVIDVEDPDERLVRLAYLWARSYAIRSVTPEDVDYDVEAIERVINNLVSEIGTLRQLKAAHTPIKENILKAQSFVENFEDKLNDFMDELRDLLSKSE